MDGKKEQMLSNKNLNLMPLQVERDGHFGEHEIDRTATKKGQIITLTSMRKVHYFNIISSIPEFD